MFIINYFKKVYEDYKDYRNFLYMDKKRKKKRPYGIGKFRLKKSGTASNNIFSKLK